MTSFVLKSVILASMAGAIAAPGSAAVRGKVIKAFGIPFVEPPTRTNYADKPDFAELEHEYPLNAEALSKLQPSDLTSTYFDTEKLDQLYARLTAGPIPDGPFDGKIVIQSDTGLAALASKFQSHQGLVAPEMKFLTAFGQMMWKGKHFYRDEKVLRNLIPDNILINGNFWALARLVFHTEPNFSNMKKSVVNGHHFNEIFPARLYCGQSLLDSRRESIIIDYAYSEDVDGNAPSNNVDFLASRKGFAVRDEIRMIRPGFYLGRAYMQRIFSLYFTLYNKQVADAGDRTESCWTGKSERQ